MVVLIFEIYPVVKVFAMEEFSEMFTLSRLGKPFKTPGVSTSAFPNVNSPCYLQGYLEIVRCLLEMDADANLANCNDNTPLWVASWTLAWAKREWLGRLVVVFLGAPVNLPSRELTYPANGKGNSFSQLPLDGIC